MVDFGNRIKNLRQKNALTQMQLAERLGLTKSVVSAYENGVRMPSYATLLAISRIFRVSTDYLLGNESRTVIDTSGLTQDEIDALSQLIRTMRQNGGK